jgi:hypothetical protein
MIADHSCLYSSPLLGTPQFFVRDFTAAQSLLLSSRKTFPSVFDIQMIYLKSSHSSITPSMLGLGQQQGVQVSADLLQL